METATSNAISFAGQVAIVTGAAGGIGRAIAFELARRGARILVNDYGGDTFGHKGNAERAEAVAAELRSIGAEAVADGTAVGTAEGARAITGAALKAFNRIDILANNAGVTLPGLINSATESDVEDHVRINLLGPYMLVRAVWPVMQQQRYGRILNTSSNAALGIGANAPYAMTKAGLIGLTCDASVEGKQHGIGVNAMMPVAYSRMIEQIPDVEFKEWFRLNFPAEKVAAAAAYLLSRECTLSGRVLDIGGGRVARIAFASGAGWFDPQITAEKLHEHLDQAVSLEDSVVLNLQEDSMSAYARLFPFARATGPSLTLDTVTRSGKE